MNADDMTNEVFSIGELVQVQDGGIVSRVIMKNAGGNVTLFAFAAGEELSEHTAPFDAMVVILEGRAEVTIANDMHELAAGQSIIMPANIPHALRASEAFKMLLVMLKDKA